MLEFSAMYCEKYLYVSEEGVLMICVPSFPFKHSKVINNIVLLQAKTIVSEGQNS